MRKIIISILLAGAAASPAFSQDNGRRHEDSDSTIVERQQAREQRNEAREQARSERSGGGGNVERSQQQREQFQARQRAQTEAHARPTGNASTDATAGTEHRQRADGVSRWTRDNVQQSGETARWTRDPSQRSGETGRWTRDRTGWTDNRTGSIRDQGDFRQSRGTQQRVNQRSRWTNGGWNRSWRNDHRYDWRNYRHNHRSVFHLGIYIDPFDYGYRSFNIGYRLQPNYYGQRYWIDPGMYSLPYPPPGTQWVRYYNDALLVDVYTGEVVDVIQNFFW